MLNLVRDGHKDYIKNLCLLNPDIYLFSNGYDLL